jgi:hypothetical protein
MPSLLVYVSDLGTAANDETFGPSTCLVIEKPRSIIEEVFTCYVLITNDHQRLSKRRAVIRSAAMADTIRPRRVRARCINPS